MAGHTRLQLREEVAKYFGMIEGTATGGTTATVVDSGLVRYGDNFFVGAEVFIKTDAGGAHAAPEGQARFITGFTSTTGTITGSPVFTIAPAAGDTYQIYRQVTKAEVDNALNKVSLGARAILALTPTDSTLDYALSATGLRSPNQILTVWCRDFNDVTRLPYQVVGWQVEDNAGTLEIRLPNLMRENDGLWIEYLLGEDGLANDTVTLNLPVDLVRVRAVCYLIENVILPRSDMAGINRWGTLLRELKVERERLERQNPPPARKAKIHGWAWDTAPAASRSDDSLGLCFSPRTDFS